MIAARRRAPVGRRALAAALACTALAAAAFAAPARAEFGFLPGAQGFDGSFTNQDGSPAAQAGTRPFAITTAFKLNATTDSEGQPVPDGTVKDVLVDLSPGLVGDFTKLPRCTTEQLVAMLSSSTERCPIDSQVGVLKAYLASPDEPSYFPIYNMVPPPGTPADFGAPALAITVRFTPSVRTGGDYGIRVSSLNTSALATLFGAETTFWGVPSDPSHDTERFPCLDPNSGPSGISCPVTFPRFPLFTMPTSCSGPLTTSIRADSWQQIGAFEQASFLSHDEAQNPYGLHGCALLGFAPSITARPQTTAADSPTALDFAVHVPQNDNPDGLASAHVRDVELKLPAGLAVNPAAAAGLAGCTLAEADLAGPGSAGCPPASKIGTVRVRTSLIDDPLEGAMFVATPFDNPFNSLLAIYLSVDDPQTGVVVKLAGELVADPATGQLTTVFKDAPQVPFDDLEVSLFGGPRAVFQTPAVCGAYTTHSEITPWSFPAAPAMAPADGFTVNAAPGGGPCTAGDPGQPGAAADLAQRPFAPALSAGTLHPLAGERSPFVLRVRRQDGQQEITRIAADLPPGLVGRLAGIPYCPEAALAAIPTEPGSGRQELDHPSCPAASRIGRVEVGAGAGPAPFYASGSVYLAGPYRGAPLSIAVVTPAVAGPFDLGNVVVRNKLAIDPDDAQIHLESDPIPTILEGIPLDIRDVRVLIDRPGFTLNPTSCDPMAVRARVSGAGDPNAAGDEASAVLADRFQVGGCAGLGFAPRLTTKALGKRRFGAHPTFRATLTAPAGQANLKRLVYTLPKSLTIDQRFTTGLCTETELALRDCAGARVYGRAVARTPLLGYAPQGPVYLVSGAGGLPRLAMILRGPPSQPVKLVVRGITRGTRAGGYRTVIPNVPDAPVSRFTLTLFGSRQSIIQNTRNLCRSRARGRVAMVAHNNMRMRRAVRLGTPGCKKKKKRRRARRR